MAKLDYVKEAVVKRNPNDAEFIQAVDEVLLSLEKSQVNIRNISKKAYSKESSNRSARSSSVYPGLMTAVSCR